MRKHHKLLGAATAVATAVALSAGIAFGDDGPPSYGAAQEQYPGEPTSGICHATAAGFWILKTGAAADAHRAHMNAGIGIHVHDREATQADIDLAAAEPGNRCAGTWK
jgi:hypothetical protein